MNLLNIYHDQIPFLRLILILPELVAAEKQWEIYGLMILVPK